MKPLVLLLKAISLLVLAMAISVVFSTMYLTAIHYSGLEFMLKSPVDPTVIELGKYSTTILLSVVITLYIQYLVHHKKGA